MPNPNSPISGKDKSTPIGLEADSAQEDLGTTEVPDGQSADDTSPDASDESED